jgi:branched-chain amino acid transport system permease protein
MLLFGGSGSLWGPVYGAVTVFLLNESLRSAEKFQMLFYGALLLLVIVGLPGGLYGVVKDIIIRIKRKRGIDNAA